MAAEARERETRPNGRAWTKPHRRHRAAIGIGHIGLILGVVALALGGSGLAIALTHAGPAGATGPKGSTGATGKNGINGTNGAPAPGAIINQSSVGPSSLVNNTTCASEPGADVGLLASGVGTVVVTAAVTIWVVQTSGDFGDVALWLGSQSALCSGHQQYVFVSTSLPANEYYVSASLVETFSVSTPGSYTYYLSGYNVGSDTAYFYETTIVGVYYPS